jgi:hypothetical protein
MSVDLKTVDWQSLFPASIAVHLFTKGCVVAMQPVSLVCVCIRSPTK